MVWAPPTGGGGGSVSISGNFPITVTGTPENPIISIVQASTTNCGAVVLNNTTTSTSVVQALTANAGKNLQDQIDAITSSGGTVQVVTGSAPVQITGDPAIAPNVTVQAGSTSSIGVVQLYDDTNSDSTTLALTANVGKTLQEQINTLVISTNLILAGTIDAATGLMKTVNVDGTAAGFVVGSPLPLPTPALANYFVIITVAGTMTPPGGVPTDCIKGDWWLCDGVQWKLVDVGTILPYATEGQPGAVCLATNLETQDGLINNKAIVPTALQSKISNSINLPSSDFIASSCAVKIAYDHATGAYAPYATQLDCGTVCLATSAEVLEGTNPNKAIVPLTLQQKMSDSITTFDSTCIASSAAVAAAATTVSDKIDRSTFTARGQVIASTGVGTYEATCCNVNGRALTVDSTSPTGLSWCPVGCGSVCIISTGIGLSGGPITSSGTISLENTTVVPGCYAYPTICVDQQGRLTFACSNESFIGNAQPQFRGFVYGSTNDFNPIAGEPVGTTALGFCALNALPTDGGTCNTALGTRAGSALTSGFNNLLLGAGAGCDITSGVCNVIIAPTAIPTGNISCRLVMSNGANTWIEGTAAGSVCFPNGIEDCVASTGLPGYVLTSTGTNLEWAQPREFSSSCGIYCTVPTAADASCLIPVWFFTDNPNAVPDYSAALKVNVGVSYNSVGGFVCGAACVFYAQYNPVTPGFENVVYGDPVLFDNRDTPNNFSSLALNWSFANACYGNFSAFGVLYNTCLCGGADFSVQQLMTVSV
jgi:hypothetical protein